MMTLFEFLDTNGGHMYQDFYPPFFELALYWNDPQVCRSLRKVMRWFAELGYCTISDVILARRVDEERDPLGGLPTFLVDGLRSEQRMHIRELDEAGEWIPVRADLRTAGVEQPALRVALASVTGDPRQTVAPRCIVVSTRASFAPDPRSDAAFDFMWEILLRAGEGLDPVLMSLGFEQSLSPLEGFCQRDHFPSFHLGFRKGILSEEALSALRLCPSIGISYSQWGCFLRQDFGSDKVEQLDHTWQASVRPEITQLVDRAGGE